MGESQANIVLTTLGFFILLADESSPAMALTLWDERHEPAARRRVVQSLCARKEALQWTVLLDGTFLVRFVVEEVPGFDDGSTADTVTRETLDLPSGQLSIRSGQLATPSQHAVALAPGRYDVRVEWFVDEETRHSELESPADYPPGEGPDGIVTLRRASNVSS